MKSNFEDFLEDFFPELIPIYQDLTISAWVRHLGFHRAIEPSEIKQKHNDFIKLSECFFEYRDRVPLDDDFPEWIDLAEWNLKEIWWDENGFLKEDFNPSKENFIIRDSPIPILELSLEYDRRLNHYDDIEGFFNLFEIYSLCYQDINYIPSYLVELDTFLAIPNSIYDIPNWNSGSFEDYLDQIEPEGFDLEYFSRNDEGIEAKIQKIRNDEPEKLLFFDLYLEDAILSDSYVKKAYDELEINRFYCSFIESYLPGSFYL